VVAELHGRFPDSRLVVFSRLENPSYVHLAMASGALGYGLKSAAPEALTDAVHRVAAGEEYVEPSLGAALAHWDGIPRWRVKDDLLALTRREQEVVELVALGHTNAEAAATLGVALRTVESHRSHIVQKLGLRTRAELVQFVTAATPQIIGRSGRGPGLRFSRRSRQPRFHGWRGPTGHHKVSRRSARHARRERIYELKRILVGVDGSDTAAAALGWAGRLAHVVGAEVVVATVFQPDQAEVSPDRYEALTQSAERLLDTEWSEPLSGSGAARRSLLLTGQPDALLEAAEREDVDLVVVGPRGHGRFARMHIGSLAHHLAHYTTRPLAIVPAPGAAAAFDRVGSASTAPRAARRLSAGAPIWPAPRMPRSSRSTRSSRWWNGFRSPILAAGGKRPSGRSRTTGWHHCARLA